MDETREETSKPPSTSQSETKEDEEKPEIDEKLEVIKIFLYGGNSYHGKAIVKELKHQEIVENSPQKSKLELLEANSEQDVSGSDVTKSSSAAPSSSNDPSASTKDSQNTLVVPSSTVYQVTSCLDPFLPCSVDDSHLIDCYIDQDMSEYHQILLDQDILIYDTNFDIKAVDEALEVTKILESWAQGSEEAVEKKKKFILISNLMTWGTTEHTDQLSSKDYRKRRPHPCYRRYLRLEQEITNLQTKYKDKIQTLVLCPGITFGYEEDILHYFFKMALYNKQYIEMFSTNDIPLLHVTELAKIVKKVIESDIYYKQKYILGFNSSVKYQHFVLEVAKMMTGMQDVRLKVVPKERMLLIDHNLLTQRSYDKLTLNLNMEPAVFNDLQFEENFEEIVKKTVDEYYEAHEIKPKKILIHGPPSCGKTTLARALACYYAAQYVNPDEILEDALMRLEKKVKRGQEYIQITEKNEVLIKNELYKEMLEDAKKINEIQEEIEVIQKAVNSKNEKTVKELKEKYLTELLNSNACTKNQGYVIDTLLYDIDVVERIFLKDTKDKEIVKKSSGEDLNESESHEDEEQKPPAKKKVSIAPPSEESSDEDVDKNIEEKEISVKESDENILLKKDIRPDIFIYLKWDESIIKKEENCTCKQFKDRFPSNIDSCATSTSTLFATASSTNSWTFLEDDPCRPFPDCQDLDKLILSPTIKKAVETHERRRFEGYLETEYEDQSLYTFMLDNGMVPFEVVIDSESTIDTIYLKIKEKLGPRNEYLISDVRREEEKRRCDEIKRRLKEKKEAKIRAEVERKRLAREKLLKEEKEVQKALRKKDVTQIEACSLPLRKYLIKYIVPKLTEALVEVAKVRPQDPIDYLAEYLFRNNPEGQMFDPCLSDQMVKKILDERLLELADEYNDDYCQCLYELDSCENDTSEK